VWFIASMNATEKAKVEAPKLALTRIEAAHALGISPATLDRLTLRGLLRPCRAMRRPLFAVKEIERFLKATTPAADWTI
jgi:hypothetical protein